MSDKLDILVFGAHPDDAEIGMGGTIIQHIRAGYRVGICDLTHAEMSSNGDVETRKKEAVEASRILGLSSRSNLGLPDRGLELCKEQIDLITLEVRRLQPEVVIAPYWKDRHPDHVLCSKLVQEAVFNAKLRKYLPHAEACQVKKLFFYFVNDTFQSDLIVDISDVHEHKMKAIRAYRTQFSMEEAGEQAVVTPLNQGYIDRVISRDRLLGEHSMMEYAEGFKTKVPYIVNHLL